MSAANGRSAERRLRRRRRKLAAATSTVLLVAAAVAGEPISLAASAVQVAGGVGGGLDGMRDPNSVGASGRVNEDDRIGDDLLDDGDVESLLKLGGDAPSDGELGIPGVMLDAYMLAEESLATTQPACNLDWPLLASIGRIESGHARNGRVDEDGNTVPNILGPVLNGGGFAAIRDTDGGRLDGDSSWDRAVGAMQFIPSTWQGYASDGNDDGVSSPHNVYDATMAAGKYLCSGGMDLSNPQDRSTAVFRYNHSNSYVATVLLWADAYAQGVSPLPSDEVPEDLAALGPPSVGTMPPYQTPPQNPPGGTPGGTTTTPTTTTTTTTTTSGPTSTTTTTTTTTTPCDTSSETTTTTTTTIITTTTDPASSPTEPTTTTTTTTEPTTTTTTAPC